MGHVIEAVVMWLKGWPRDARGGHVTKEVVTWQKRWSCDYRLVCLVGGCLCMCAVRVCERVVRVVDVCGLVCVGWCECVCACEFLWVGWWMRCCTSSYISRSFRTVSISKKRRYWPSSLVYITSVAWLCACLLWCWLLWWLICMLAIFYSTTHAHTPTHTHTHMKKEVETERERKRERRIRERERGCLSNR